MLDQGVETKGGACFTLAPAAVTALHHEGLGLHAIAYVFAVATALEREWIFRLKRRHVVFQCALPALGVQTSFVRGRNVCFNGPEVLRCARK